MTIDGNGNCWRAERPVPVGHPSDVAYYSVGLYLNDHHIGHAVIEGRADALNVMDFVNRGRLV